MNTVAHLTVSYAIGAYLTNEPALMLLAVLSGMLPDLDHLPHVTKALKTGRFGPQSRSKYHELYGLTIIAFIAVAAAPVNPLLSSLIFIPYLAHQLLDFLTRPTRPLNPVDETETHLEIYPKSIAGLTIADALVTAGLVIWLIL